MKNLQNCYLSHFCWMEKIDYSFKSLSSGKGNITLRDLGRCSRRPAQESYSFTQRCAGREREGPRPQSPVYLAPPRQPAPRRARWGHSSLPTPTPASSLCPHMDTVPVPGKRGAAGSRLPCCPPTRFPCSPEGPCPVLGYVPRRLPLQEQSPGQCHPSFPLPSGFRLTTVP